MGLLNQTPDGFDLDRKPRVAILVETAIPPVSRANVRMYWLAKALIEDHRFMVNMISPSYNLKTRKSYFTEWIWMNQFPGWSCHLYSALRLPVRIWHFVASILSVMVLQTWYKLSGYPGFAYVHAWNPLAGLAAVLAGKLIKRPVFVDFTDFYSDIARTDMPLLRVPLIWLENYVLRQSEKIFVVSEAMREHLQANLALDTDKIVIVPDGTDAQRFRPGLDTIGVREKLGVSDEAPLLVFHGDIKHDDGVDMLIRTLAKIREKHPDTRLLVLGGGSYFETEIRALIEELGQTEAVITPGWIPHEEVARVLNACDIGCMTMRATLNHHKYLSFKLFEYWGCGKPVVCTRLEAIGQFMRDGHNGLVVDDEDLEGYVAAFLRLIESPDQARQIGSAGRQLVEQEFDWREIMKREVACFEDGQE
ncbi:MAG: glycosyltransferase family 4 protein [bacterium]|nr:glycosyltransferase family 4 protein [bacterium]